MNTTFGRYRLLERIGQGGMAEVFKAKSYGVEGFEKVVVIKRILPDLARSKEFVDMFIHEAKLAVRLSHANIVQVFDLGIAPGGEVLGSRQPDAYYMAMEYVHGLDLATLLARARREHMSLPPEMCAYIVAEVAKGLDHAHRRRDEQMRPLNVVHRDVSPQNVLLSLEGEVKVTDFGIAKARGALDTNDEDTKARKLQGKFSYMSPEQARGENVDASSDIFSLGTVLYECLVGVSPFAAPTTFETLRRVQQCEYPPAELARPDIPADLAQILKTAMARVPTERFTDAGRMHEALLAFQYGHGHRFSSADLALFLARFRAQEDASQTQFGSLEAQERTPVDAQPLGATVSAAVPAVDPEVSDLGERRDLTALALVLFDRGPLPDTAESTIERYGGSILRAEAGLVLALFGLTDPDGRDTETATRCGLVLVRTLTGASVGVHVGRVYVTRENQAGEDERLGALVDGAIALARCADQACAVSPAAAKQVRALFELSEMEHAVERGSLVRDVRPLSEAFGRFVGRREQLRRVGEVLALATKRRAQALTIRGDNGVGKTRLLVEIERRLRKGNYNVGFHLATCPPQGRTIPHSGIVCMLQELVGLKEGEPVRVDVVSPRLRALGLQEEEVGAVLGVLGVSVPSSEGDLRPALRAAFGRMVTSLCDDRPHYFAWDAAHCMDAESLSLIEAVFDRLASVRVVFAFAVRAGFSHALERLPNHLTLDLTDLPDEDADRLVAARLGVEQAPPEILTFIRERAGGHPLFIEEVLKGLLAARAVTVADRKVVSVRLVGQDLALPKTLRGLVASRVAQLEDEERATLYAAAVVGDPVDVEVLGRMTKKPLPELERSVHALSARDFLVHTGPTELRFRSPIVREVVVDALPAVSSRELHAAAGAALESHYGESSIEHAGRIATHLYEAGDRERAATYFARSAERRLESRQLEGAARDYARAIGLCEPRNRDPSELAAWLSGLAAAVRLVRAAPEAVELCERVIARADASGDAPLRVAVRVHAGRVLGAVHMIDLARAQFSAAEQIAAADDVLVKLVLSAAAELASRQGDFRRSLTLYERLEKLVGTFGSKQEEHKTLVGLAQARAAIGDRRGALSCLARAERLLPADAPSACERQRVRGLIDYFAADHRAASAAVELAIDAARHLGLTYEVAENLHTLGEIFIRLDDLPRAYGALKQALALTDESGHERLAVYCRTFLAFLDAVAGDRDADKRLREGILYAEANDFTWDRLSGHWLQALLSARRGASDAARIEYQKLLELAREAGNQLVERDCERALSGFGRG